MELFGTNVESYNKHINKGWNLTPLPTSSSLYLPEALIVWHYDALTQQWQIYSEHYDEFLQDSQIPLITNTSSSKAYWVFANNEFDLSFENSVLENFDDDNLTDGWHMVSTYDGISDFSTIMQNSEIAWLYSNNEWRVKAFENNIQTQIDDTNYTAFTTIPAKTGFWIKIKKNLIPSSEAGIVLQSDIVKFVESVNFAVQASDEHNDTLRYLWDFTDGNISTLQNPQHIFYDSGEYNVSFTITDEKGASIKLYTLLSVYNSYTLNDSEQEDCSQDNQKQYVYNLMKDVYYWYDSLPNINIDDYNSSEELFYDLLYDQIDTWSSIQDTTDSTNYFSYGQTKGYGIQIGIDYYWNMWITYIEPNSPADLVGVKRGDKITKIGSYSAYEIVNSDLWDEFDKDSNTFEFTRLDHTTYTKILSQSTYTIETTPIKKIFPIDNHKVGYLLFSSFIEPAFDTLDSIFSDFKAQNVDYLILDLRYNGGGLLSVATYLASLISNSSSDKLFTQLTFNDKHQEYNTQFYLYDLPNALNIQTLFVLTGRRTCSASEAIINGLKPYINVITIGSETCGKSYGMNDWSFCDKTLYPITFKGVNEQNQSFPTTGITPDYYAPDYIDYQLGDENEMRLKSAFNYIKNGSFSSGLSRSFGNSRPNTTLKPPPLKGFKKEVGSF